MTRYGYGDRFDSVVDYEREASRDPGLDYEPDDDRPSPAELAEERAEQAAAERARRRRVLAASDPEPV